MFKSEGNKSQNIHDPIMHEQNKMSVSQPLVFNLPLLKDYAEDQDLTYYMKTVFSEYQHRKYFVDEIISGISGLRKAGLP